MNTIYNNLTYNTKLHKVKLLDELLISFNFKNMITSLPDGFETIINDNIRNLS